MPLGSFLDPHLRAFQGEKGTQHTSAHQGHGIAINVAGPLLLPTRTDLLSTEFLTTQSFQRNGWCVLYHSKHIHS